MNDLNSLFSLLAEEKKKKKEIEDKLKQSIKEDVDGLFSKLSSEPEQEAPVEQIKEEVLTEVVTNSPTPEVKEPNTMDSVGKYLTGKSFQQPEPDRVAPELRAVTEKIKFLEQAISRIAATGPGGGEVNLRWLDDVDRPSIYDMRFLRYNATKKKFEFAEVNPHDIVYTTHLVTTSTYTVDSDDYYVGVNYAGPCIITLPTTSLSSGRSIVIKDESGAAETNPITVVGTVDNDAGGFIIQINNGATQLIYRDGWRII
jgi:hypothetical protein